MARSASERLEVLLSTRDAIDDALLASAGSADVVRYKIADREVERSRVDAMKALTEINKQISSLQSSVYGMASNSLVLRRRP